jgi:hypothetical protein
MCEGVTGVSMVMQRCGWQFIIDIPVTIALQSLVQTFSHRAPFLGTVVKEGKKSEATMSDDENDDFTKEDIDLLASVINTRIESQLQQRDSQLLDMKRSMTKFMKTVSMLSKATEVAIQRKQQAQPTRQNRVRKSSIPSAYHEPTVQISRETAPPPESDSWRSGPKSARKVRDFAC